MKIKIQDLREIKNSIDLLGDVRNAKFAYALLKNRNRIETEIKNAENVLSTMKYTDEENTRFIEYDKKRVDLARKHSHKDENGKPKQKQIGDRIVFDLIDEEKFEKELELLKKDYKDVLQKRDDFEKKILEINDLEIEFNFHTIKTDDIPADLSLSQLLGIKIILEGLED